MFASSTAVNLATVDSLELELLAYGRELVHGSLALGSHLVL